MRMNNEYDEHDDLNDVADAAVLRRLQINCNELSIPISKCMTAICNNRSTNA